MSFIAALLIAQAGAAPAAVPTTPPAPHVAEEMSVIDDRIADWKGGIYKRDGKLTCRIEQSTGDSEVDMIRCGAMIRCFAPLSDAMDAVAGSDLPDADRNRQMRELAGTAQPCLEAATNAGVRMLAEKRQNG